MKEENKCFFSISLENGITITGESPKQVKDFLMTTQSAYHTQAVQYLEKNHEELAKECIDLFWEFNEAINTIFNHLNK